MLTMCFTMHLHDVFHDAFLRCDRLFFGKTPPSVTWPYSVALENSPKRLEFQPSSRGGSHRKNAARRAIPGVRSCSYRRRTPVSVLTCAWCASSSCGPSTAKRFQHPWKMARMRSTLCYCTCCRMRSSSEYWLRYVHTTTSTHVVISSHTHTHTHTDKIAPAKMGQQTPHHGVHRTHIQLCA